MVRATTTSAARWTSMGRCSLSCLRSFHLLERRKRAGQAPIYPWPTNFRTHGHSTMAAGHVQPYREAKRCGLERKTASTKALRDNYIIQLMDWVVDGDEIRARKND